MYVYRSGNQGGNEPEELKRDRQGGGRAERVFEGLSVIEPLSDVRAQTRRRSTPYRSIALREDKTLLADAE